MISVIDMHSSHLVMLPGVHSIIIHVQIYYRQSVYPALPREHAVQSMLMHSHIGHNKFHMCMYCTMQVY